MSTAELIKAIEALPPEKQKEVEGFVQGLVEGQNGSPRFADVEEARKVSGRIFEENAELFKKLAQ